ncbi:zona pellucida sperm-binding protein 3d.2 [Chanos chanos]|uniref:Zona pellucida sperm-binding protein 3 n=1 Tax=Chanos chanos TaxID=29144 RepID=A0A6J2W4L1_CHACN|nr:zona pellucida sperm-binding protein 3-like [Chanos chanos]
MNRSRTGYLKDDYSSFSSPYLHLPAFQHSRSPLVDKEHFLPMHGTGQERLPENMRKILIPVAPSQTPATPRKRTRGIIVMCKLNKMLVRVHKGFTAYVEPQSLTLGTCEVNKLTKHYFFFLYGLNQCGTKTKRINNRMVYYNTLRYAPMMTMGPVRRVTPFSLSIECHFNRYHYSYKIGYMPRVEIQEVYKPMKNMANFTLTPSNAQWESISPSEGYIIGHPMYFVAMAPTVSEGKRLYVPSCYVTLSRSHTSAPRFMVINNFGCLTDSKNSSQSQFFASEKNSLRFSTGAFLFQGTMQKHLYMHCEMTVESESPTPTAKSCAFNQRTSRWEELNGSNDVCSCCDSKCPSSDPDASHKVISSGPFSSDHHVKSLEVEVTKPPLQPGEEVHASVTTEPWTTAEDSQVKGLAVVEEEEEEEKVPKTHLIFEDVFGLD